MTSSRQCLFVGQSVSSSSTSYRSQLSQATLRTTSVFAVVSLIFGAGCAVLMPASLEQRLGSFLLFGLAPAICFMQAATFFVECWSLLGTCSNWLQPAAFDAPRDC